MANAADELDGGDKFLDGLRRNELTWYTQEHGEGDASSSGQTPAKTFGIDICNNFNNISLQPTILDVVDDIPRLREEFLNSDLSLNGHGLSHNDLRSRLATILRKMILVYDPIYKPIVMEESENLISNFRTSRPLRCDISVSMSFNNFIKPFLVGEVKEGKELFNNLIDVLKQLLGYQIILERPYSTDEEEGVNFLLGFATDNYTFVLLELAIRDWLSPDLISVVRCIQINRQQNNEYFHAQCFQYLLDKSIHSVPQLLDNTFRYRLYGVSALSHCNVVKLPFSVLNEDFLISLMDTNELSYTNIRLLSTIKQEDFVILKVSGSFFSGGVRNYEKFIKLLNAIKNIPIGMQNSMLMTLDQLYVKVFRLTAPSNLIVSIMNYSLNSCDCECGFLQQFWNVDRDLRNNFYYDVYCVATDAITQNVFHWDIRRANILVLTNKRFRIIDWESVEFLDNADSIKLANARLNISKLTLHNCSIFVNLDFLLRPALFILESILRCVKLFKFHLIQPEPEDNPTNIPQIRIQEQEMENWETNILTIIKHRATEDIQRDKNISLEQFRIQVLDPSIKEILAIDE